jgi:hypothetical protein
MAHQMASASTTAIEDLALERVRDHCDVRSIQDGRRNFEAACEVT